MAGTGVKVAAIAALAVGGGTALYYFVLRPWLAGGGPQVTACFIIGPGNCSSNGDYELGDTMQLAVTVPSTSAPVSVQAIIGGNAGSEHPWDPATQGYTYTIDFGVANAEQAPENVTAIVTFEDGSTSTTNVCTVSVG